MSDNANELKQCSRCNSTILLKYFEVNRKGELFKTCNNCRNNDKKYKDSHLAETKQYRESRKEERLEYDKTYREENKEHIQQRSKQYYENNKDKITAHAATQITCVCGLTHRLGDKAKHEKTQAHYDNLNPTPGKVYVMPDGSLGYISNIILTDSKMDELMREGYKCILGISETGKKTIVPKGWVLG